MADEEGQEKTEEPTQRKIEQALEKGQVARSRDLVSVVMLIIGAFLLMAFCEMLYDSIARIFELCLVIDRDMLFDTEALVPLLLAVFKDIGMALLPLLIFLMIVTIATSTMNGGWNFSGHPLKFNLEKINPLAGLKRMFSVQSVVELVKSILKVTLVGTATFFIISAQMGDYLKLTYEPVRSAIVHGVDMVGWAFLWLSVSLILVVAIDVPYQIWTFRKQLRMTQQEIKQEYRDSEGKPEVKGKQRQRARELAFSGMMAEVPKADVVITNPTHFAVALKYDPASSGAPRLVAKGADLVAEQIKTVARANNVIILTAPPLARSIFYHTKLFREIPAGLYVAVAQVLAYVYHLKRYQQGQGPNPGRPPEVDVPPELRRG